MNFLDFKLNISFLTEFNRSECDGTNLLVLIPSSPTNLQKRNEIRETLFQDQDNGTLIKFVIGQSLDPEINAKLISENKMFDDLILADFVDSYRNLSIKTFSILVLKHFYCPNTQHLLTMDDDVIVDFDRLRHWISTIWESGIQSKFLACDILRSTRIYRIPGHRW
uniref:Hexosyltransferase n=1 Tax=Panagrolaimus sp. JU765 TaxID=591449 RepID=A0AC34Q4L5_9BILA